MDYYPFGMLVPSRHGSSDSYRYGFQGQEKDDEIKGEGNSLNYTYRMHDPRIGRFFAPDPLTKEYPHYTTYSFSGNKVISSAEFEGLEDVWVADGSKIVKKVGPYVGAYTSEQAANNRYLEFTARKPKVAKPLAEIRSDDLEAQVNKYRGVNPGLAISRGVIDGFQEAPGIVLPEIAFAKAAKLYEGYKVFKQSKIAANALAGGFEVLSEGKKGKGLVKLAQNINSIGGDENCVLVSIEFQKKLLKRVYSASGGGKALNADEIMAYLYKNFNDVNIFRSLNGGFNDLVNVLKNKVTSNSSIVIGRLIESGKVDEHAFNAIKNSDNSWKFIDAQNGVEYTKAGMEKTFSSYKIFEVK